MLQFLLGTKINDEQSMGINTAIQSTQALSQLLSDVLDLSKVEAGKLIINKTPISMGKISRLLEDLVQLFSNQLQRKGLSLFLDFPLEFSFKIRNNSSAIKPVLDQFIISDLLRIRQVLVNLISNAIKYTNTGSIFVRLKINFGKNIQFPIRFEVQDTGVGIAKDKLQSVFHRFCRIENSDDNNNNNSDNTNNNNIENNSNDCNSNNTNDISSHSLPNMNNNNNINNSNINNDNNYNLNEKVNNKIKMIDENNKKKKYEKAEGTGIGLTIAKQITKILAGDLSVSSTIGVGTIFTFSLPQRITKNKNNKKDENNTPRYRKNSAPNSPNTPNRSKSVPSMYIDPLRHSFSNLHYLPPPSDLPSVELIGNLLNSSHLVVISKNSYQIFSDSIHEFFHQNGAFIYSSTHLDLLSHFPQIITPPSSNQSFDLISHKSNNNNNNNKLNNNINNNNNNEGLDKIKEKVNLFEKRQSLIILLDTKMLFEENDFLKLTSSFSANAILTNNFNYDHNTPQNQNDQRELGQFWITTVKKAINQIYQSTEEMFFSTRQVQLRSRNSIEKNKISPYHPVCGARLFLILPQMFSSLLSILLTSPDISWYSGWISDPVLPLRLITLITSPVQPTLSLTNSSNVLTSSFLSNVKLTFLIADDNKVNQLVIKKLLTQLLPSIIIHFAMNGQESLELFTNNINNNDRSGYDMVMLDLNMPIMDGFEATRRIRELENSRKLIPQRTPIIGFTASTVSDINQQCLDAGMDDVLNKPIIKNELINFLNIFLNIDC